MLTQAQLEMRRSGIGASEIPAVVNQSPFMDRPMLYALKTGLIEQVESPAMTAGGWLEDGVAARAAHERGWKLQRCNRTLRHREHKWMLATPDRFVVVNRKRDSGVEIKTSHSLDTHAGWGEDGSNQVPPHVHCQVQQQMSVTGMRVTHVVLFTFADRQQRYYEVPHSQALEDVLVAAGTDFWNNHVLADVPPPIDMRSPYTKRVLGLLYPDPSDVIQPAPLASDEWAVKLADARKRKDDVEAEVEMLENVMRNFVGEAKGIEGIWGKFLWSKVKGKVHDSKLIDHLMDMLKLSPAERTALREQFRGESYRRISFSYKPPAPDDEPVS